MLPALPVAALVPLVTAVGGAALLLAHRRAGELLAGGGVPLLAGGGGPLLAGALQGAGGPAGPGPGQEAGGQAVDRAQQQEQEALEEELCLNALLDPEAGAPQHLVGLSPGWGAWVVAAHELISGCMAMVVLGPRCTCG